MSKTNAAATAKPHRGGVKTERAARGPLDVAVVKTWLAGDFAKAPEAIASPEPTFGAEKGGMAPVNLTGIQVGSLLDFCRSTKGKGSKPSKDLLADFPKAKQDTYIALYRKALGEDVEVPEYKWATSRSRGKGGKPVQEPVTVTNEAGEIPGFEVVRGKISVGEIEALAAEVAAEAEAAMTVEADLTNVGEVTEDMTFEPETEVGEKEAAALAEAAEIEDEVKILEYADGLGPNATKAEIVEALQKAGDKRATSTLMKKTYADLESLLVAARQGAKVA
jgi:hypothetical protein